MGKKELNLANSENYIENRAQNYENNIHCLPQGSLQYVQNPCSIGYVRQSNFLFVILKKKKNVLFSQIGNYLKITFKTAL